MAPFTQGQLVLSEITYDGQLAAMRVRLHGLRAGLVDLAVIRDHTYALAGPETCTDLGDTGWRPLPQDLVGSTSTCEGTAPIAETPVSWWKLPTDPSPAASWIWFAERDESPFRLMFAHPRDDFAPLGWFAFSYQLRFDSLAQTDLAPVVASCERTGRPGPPSAAGRRLREKLAGMEQSGTANEISTIAPELAAPCPQDPLPTWPDRLRMTTLMTPINRHYSPLPSEVLYDWAIKAQRTRMHGLPKLLFEDALLLGSVGYDIEHRRTGLQCTASQPGTVRPNWMQTAPCRCEAFIRGNTTLTPYGSTRVFACPMTKPRLLWSWYTEEGRPMVFMETAAPGDEKVGLLTLADYYYWGPNEPVAKDVFVKPAQCPRSGPAPANRPVRQCAHCHVDGPEN